MELDDSRSFYLGLLVGGYTEEINGRTYTGQDVIDAMGRTEIDVTPELARFILHAIHEHRDRLDDPGDVRGLEAELQAISTQD
ncbi:hypothetical protein HUG10_21035 (plasmid) [Halorarum halophilum]|uniref:Uncharacterized protein n=1 Tax=Halorarum halophilum TaxID=2743090 RepID=A0A7D5H468_9EURY|nr:hypothetical protein [Halobaculum halophilum]QLG30073.1 hypothetical protein HUG10_21035 [Halobaculum halophilum]